MKRNKIKVFKVILKYPISVDIDFKVTFEAINMLKTSPTKQQLLLLLNFNQKKSLFIPWEGGLGVFLVNDVYRRAQFEKCYSLFQIRID